MLKILMCSSSFSSFRFGNSPQPPAPSPKKAWEKGRRLILCCKANGVHKGYFPSARFLLLMLMAVWATLFGSPIRAQEKAVVENDIEYANPDNQHLKINMARPAQGNGPFPCILYIHGGGFAGGSRKDYDGMLRPSAERGYVAATVEYRLTPQYPFPAAIHDVKAAVRWLRSHAAQYHIDPDRIGATGHSAGGHLAAFLGVTGDVGAFEGVEGNAEQFSRIQCVVDYSGPIDYAHPYGNKMDAPQFLGGDLQTARAAHILASPFYWITPHAAPTLCIHGTKDELVAYEQSTSFVDKLKAAGVDAELLTLEEEGHGYSAAGNKRAHEAMFAFFDKHLKGVRQAQNNPLQNNSQTQSNPQPLPTLTVTTVDASTLDNKVMCGYQGWFRCPGDAAGMGWIHWSRDSKQITPETLTFEMWPDVREYTQEERFAAPGFTYPDGKPAELYSADNARTVLRHFEWMRDYGIDGAWLQHFVVDLPGGRDAVRYPSRLNVLNHVRAAAIQTGRVWALSYDIAGMPNDRIFDALTADWKRMVDTGVTVDKRYLHQNQKPVVNIWGFFANNANNAMTPELANRLIDFFKTPGRYAAFLLGGGDWNWRHNPDPEWQKFVRRFDAYAPWNVGNYSTDAAGLKHASTGYWAEDKRDCQARGEIWLPVIYPGFSWDNLLRKPAGASLIARRGGQFLWEQFHELAKMGVHSAYVAMFDEVDEGTAIYKVTSQPPTQAHLVGYENLPSDWYLRLTGEGAKMLRGQRSLTADIPIKAK